MEGSNTFWDAIIGFINDALSSVGLTGQDDGMETYDSGSSLPQLRTEYPIWDPSQSPAFYPLVYDPRIDSGDPGYIMEPIDAGGKLFGDPGWGGSTAEWPPTQYEPPRVDRSNGSRLWYAEETQRAWH